MNVNWETKLRSHQMLTLAGVGSLLMVGSAFAYHWLINRPSQQKISVASSGIEKISSLGRLEPEGELIHVAAPTSLNGAKVEILKVNHGQQIHKGDVIAILDTYTRGETSLREGQEQVAVAQSRLKQVEAGAKLGQIQAQRQVVERLQTELQTQTDAKKAAILLLEAELRNAELENRRFQSLYTQGAVSTSFRDSKQLTADVAWQKLSQARTELKQIQNSGQKQIAEAQATLRQIAEVRPVDIAVMRSQLAQAQASVKRAQAELDLAIVRSPQDGQVLKINTRPGELVGSQGIISLGRTDRMVAVAEVYELDVSRVRVGQSATVISKNKAFSDVLQGKVIEVGLEIRKQDVLNTDPAAQFDARVVEVKILLDQSSSRKVAGLTNLSIQAMIDVQSR